MTIRRDDILGALVTLLQGAEPFPERVDPEAAEIQDLSPVPDAPGLQHGAAIDGGDFEGTRDAGPLDQWEGVRGVTVAYEVTGADTAARRARAAAVVPMLEAMCAAHRDLDLGDPQVWAELGETFQGDIPGPPGAPPVSRISATLNVTYVAASAAG